MTLGRKHRAYITIVRTQQQQAARQLQYHSSDRADEFSQSYSAISRKP